MTSKAVGATPFPHAAHLDIDFGCDDCHPDLFKAKLGGNRMTMAAMQAGE
jgi:c(7)-type cytochrome triheme protein